jgi:polyhydroxyalkanoate synthesis regulator phasin
MAGADDMVLPMLREMREAMRKGFDDVAKRFSDMDERFDRIEKRQDAQKNAFAGESVLARYAAKEVDERLLALEREVAELRAGR